MVRGIPSIISPELMKILMEMGHGDEIVFGNDNFPAAALALRLVRSDGHTISALLEAVLRFFPLDSFAEKSVTLMDVTDKESKKPAIWENYRKLIHKCEPSADFELIDRFEFYERAKKAYAVVATGENTRYSNIILKKGIVEG
jgi:L-fucose mutarotase